MKGDREKKGIYMWPKGLIPCHNYQLMWHYSSRKTTLHQTDENLNNWFSRGPNALDPREIIEPINWKRCNCFRPILLALGKEKLITEVIDRNCGWNIIELLIDNEYIYFLFSHYYVFQYAQRSILYKSFRS